MQTTIATSRAVLCDDDPMVRSVIARLMTDAGYEVVAEAEDWAGAAQAITANAAGTVVLDLSLPGGNGEELIRQLHATGADVRVVVFSAFAGNIGALLDAGAAAVVEKPDFAELEAVVTELLQRVDGPGERRRPPTRPVATLPPPTAITLSGFEPWASFERAVAQLLEGDALLALDVVPDAIRRPVWDDVHRVDHRIALGRAAATTRRADDRISVSPAGMPVVALVGTHAEAPGALFDRLERVWRREVALGIPVGAFAHVHPEVRPRELLQRVVESLSEKEPQASQPLRIV